MATLLCLDDESTLRQSVKPLSSATHWGIRASTLKPPRCAPLCRVVDECWADQHPS